MNTRLLIYPFVVSIFLGGLSFCSSEGSAQADETSWDVVVYGGTSGAVTSAVQAKRMGKSVVIVSPDRHLGGLSSGGLGWTDSGDKAVIGGLAREFYHQIWLHYDQEESWAWQEQEEYGGRGQGAPAIDGDSRTMWIFEPQAAEGVFDRWVDQYEIPVNRESPLDRENGVQVEAERIVSITTLAGDTYNGRMFIDGTYEGDLMAAAGVDYHVGREPAAQYDELWNGNQIGVQHHRHHFGVLSTPIDPYITPGDPTSGLLPRISPNPPGEKFTGDNRVQAYCFRMCLTNVPENCVPFSRPEGYDPAEYELLGRIFDAGWRDSFGKFDPIPNYKTDTNNHGPFSTDNIGRNYDYPEASYERRAEIIQEHADYQQGMMYYLANDPRVPDEIREEMSKWGLARDEFVDNGNWPHQIYVREARRMVGDFVMTENELLKRSPVPDPVGMGSYGMDSHNIQRYVAEDGSVQNEGDIGVSTNGPYQIAYASLTPKKEQCENLLVPVAVSSSHIAYGSIRMEPVFMILGQSAGTAVCMALEEGIAVQDLSYESLSTRLIEDGQVLQTPEASLSRGGRSVLPAKLEGIVIDDVKATKIGDWISSSAQGRWVGYNYLHDDNTGQGEKLARFETELAEPGSYEVRLAYSPSSNRATNALVAIEHEGGIATLTVDQQVEPPIDGLFVSLGTYGFQDAASVTISNEGANGYVIADAVQLIYTP
jgi:hypothetical protein